MIAAEVTRRPVACAIQEIRLLPSKIENHQQTRKSFIISIFCPAPTAFVMLGGYGVWGFFRHALSNSLTAHFVENISPIHRHGLLPMNLSSSDSIPARTGDEMIGNLATLTEEVLEHLRGISVVAYLQGFDQRFGFHVNRKSWMCRREFKRGFLREFKRGQILE